MISLPLIAHRALDVSYSPSTKEAHIRLLTENSKLQGLTRLSIAPCAEACSLRYLTRLRSLEIGPARYISANDLAPSLTQLTISTRNIQVLTHLTLLQSLTLHANTRKSFKQQFIYK